MQPTATGLLSVQAELQQRRQQQQQQQQQAEKTRAQDEYAVSAFKGKKLSHDFHMPSEGTNRALPPSEPKNRRTALLDIDKYRARGRGPNVSLLSSTAKTPSARLEQERLRVLQAKARAYEELARNAAQDDDDDDDDDENDDEHNELVGGLIDFRRKAAEQEEAGGAEAGPSRQQQEQQQQQQPFFEDGYEEEEEQVTYIDDLGRTRTVPRSQVPPEHLQQQPDFHGNGPDQNIAYGRQTAFPVYRPPSPKIRVSRALRKQIESGAPPLQHFDPKAEVRNRGAGLFHFSKDETGRVAQMEALQRERDRTERERRARMGEDDRAGPHALEGFTSVQDRPWGAEGDDYEEGALPEHAYEQDAMGASSSRWHERAYLQRRGPEPEPEPAPLDPFAAVEMAAKRKASPLIKEEEEEGDEGHEPEPEPEPFDPFAAVELAARAHQSAASGSESKHKHKHKRRKKGDDRR
ncbi:hypothetical protein OC844_003286 [Tilletia horrida]|nr:hypothetical protein OC844_003286 [Tilletia horrida]